MNCTLLHAGPSLDHCSQAGGKNFETLALASRFAHLCTVCNRALKLISSLVR